MTKTIKLTQDYIDNWKDPRGTNSRLSANGKIIFIYTNPTNVEGESFRSKDIAADPTNVPIYSIPSEVQLLHRLKKEKISELELATYIIRHEGSNAAPPTTDIECYGCNEGESIVMPTATADKWLATKFATLPVKNNNQTSEQKNVFEEIT